MFKLVNSVTRLSEIIDVVIVSMRSFKELFHENSFIGIRVTKGFPDNIALCG